MKKILMMTVLLVSGLASASELACYGRIVDLNTAALEREDIKIENTNAVGFSAEGGQMISGDLKLEVYRNLSSNTTNLQISKKNKSDITPYLELASSQGWGLVEGQLVSVNAVVDNKNVRISCTVK